MQQKAYRGIGMEGPIARWYTSTVRKHLQDYVELAERISKSPRDQDISRSNSRGVAISESPASTSVKPL